MAGKQPTAATVGMGFGLGALLSGTLGTIAVSAWGPVLIGLVLFALFFVCAVATAMQEK